MEKLKELLCMDKIRNENFIPLILNRTIGFQSFSTIGVDLHNIAILAQRLTFKLDIVGGSFF